MSLISQNALVKDGRVKKAKRGLDSKPSLLDVVGDFKHTPDSDSDDLDQYKKKRKWNEAENKRKLMEQEKDMKSLENSLFGSLYSPVEFGKNLKQEAGLEKSSDSALFIMDRSADNDLSGYEEDIDYEEGTDDEKEQRKPAWVDDEEEKTAVNIAKVNRLRKLRKKEDETVITGADYVSRLRAQYVKMNPSTEWAQLDSKAKNYSSDDEDSEVEDGTVAPGYKTADHVDNLLRTNEDLIVKSNGRLLPGILEYSKLVDANAQDPSNGPINSVQFHRNAQLLMTAGLDRQLRFFQVDGKRNPKVQSIFLEDCPARKASFLPDGSQVIIAGRRKFFYSLDLVKAAVDRIGPLTGREERSLESFEVSPDSSTIAFLGNEGYILLVSTKTKELIGTLKMNGTVRSIAFSPDGQQLLSSGGDGIVYHWDLKTRRCFHRGVDEGSINGTALCTAPVGNLFAAGSASGIVNVYSREEFLGGKKKPLKAIENLTTKVDFMKFNHDSQVLAICSHMKKNGMKLIHIPSFTAFSNWPVPNQNLQYPRCLDFSPGGGFMAMGNAAGKVYLYTLHHYHHA